MSSAETGCRASLDTRRARIKRESEWQHTVDLLERELLGLAHKQENHEPRNQVEAGVEPERAGRRHDGAHARESYAEHAG